MTQRRSIYCCACAKDVEARLTSGREIYPHRPDLASLPFWRCDACKGFVGCHHKTKARTNPLGCIPTPELKEARKHIHALIDPAWQSGAVDRRALYQAISDRIGWQYHTAKLRNIEEARTVYRVAREAIAAAESARQAPNADAPAPRSRRAPPTPQRTPARGRGG